MKLAVIAGSGLIGTKLVKLLRQRGHEAVAASPSSGVTPGDNPRLGTTRFDEWLSRSAPSRQAERAPQR